MMRDVKKNCAIGHIPYLSTALALTPAPCPSQTRTKLDVIYTQRTRQTELIGEVLSQGMYRTKSPPLTLRGGGGIRGGMFGGEGGRVGGEVRGVGVKGEYGGVRGTPQTAGVM